MRSRLIKSASLLLGVIILILVTVSCSSSTIGNGSGNTNNGTNNNGTSTGNSSSTQGTSTIVSKYFQEDFNGNLDGWSHYVVDGSTLQILQKDPNDMNLGIQNGFFVFDLKGKSEWVDAIYNTQTYDDVRIDVSAANRGANKNNIGLICRYSVNRGWYEFDITNSGLYYIYYAQKSPDNKIIYSPLANGGSNKIKAGLNTNKYAVTCQGRTLTLYINDIQTRQIDDNQYDLKSGNIGVSVASFDVLPITVGFDWIKISQP
jgi:hypothetical protein